MDLETYNNNLLGKPHFLPYFPNKTTLVASIYSRDVACRVSTKVVLFWK